jgi:hypothetical protein
MNPNTAMVQACITSVSFPVTLSDVRKMIEKNAYAGELCSDMDILLKFDPSLGTIWTAPSWMTENDLLFFYHTRRAQQRTRKLLREARAAIWKDRRLIAFLERASQHAGQYGGTLFGCATVSGPTAYTRDDRTHFAKRTFAPLGRVHIFDKPLPLDRITDVVRIGQNTTTPLFGPQFEAIRAGLSEQNELPPFLATARSGDKTFRYVNQENWPLISGQSHARFIYEDQLRTCWLDFVLNELKDDGTPLLIECNCLRQGRGTGIADYFIQVHGVWVPVEAKLNMMAEPDLLGQIAKYMNLEAFQRKKKQYEMTPRNLCLVGDQSGVYVVVGNQYIGCEPGEPVWSRERLDHTTIPMMRDHLRQLLSC